MDPCVLVGFLVLPCVGSHGWAPLGGPTWSLVTGPRSVTGHPQWLLGPWLLNPWLLDPLLIFGSRRLPSLGFHGCGPVPFGLLDPCVLIGPLGLPCVCSHAWAPLDVRARTLVTGPRLLTGPHQLLLPPLVTGALVTKSFATNWILWDLIGGLPWVGPLDEQLEAH